MTSKVYGCICIKSVKGVWIRGGAFLDWKWHPSFLLMFYWQECDSPFKIKGRGLGSLVSEGQHFWSITVYCGRETTHIWQRQSRNICRCCCSVTKMCPTLCDPMDCSIPGFLSFTNSRSLLKFMSIELMMPYNYLILCHPLLLLPSVFPSIRVFSKKLALCIRWPVYWSVRFSISLPMNIQGCFPLGLTSLISLLSKGLSRVFSSTRVQKHQFFGS